jgi:uncharacterized membrane protein YeaQ/YmgE (transglycosylase-associated protein family)
MPDGFADAEWHDDCFIGRRRYTTTGQRATGSPVAAVGAVRAEEASVGDIILWLIIGAVVGGLASLIVPGRTPGGAIGAVIVGILGGILGGWLVDVVFDAENFGFIGSIVVGLIGAVIILYVLRSTGNRSRI